MTVSSFNVDGTPFLLEAPTRRPAALRFGIAVLVVAASALVSVLLRPASYLAPFLFFYPAPLIAFLVGGRGPALLAAVFSAIVADYLQLPPHNVLDLQPVHLLADAYFIFTFGIIAWIAERHRHWAASEIERQRELLNLADEPIGIRDKLGRVIFWNRGAERLYGWDRGEVLGRNPFDLLKTRFPKSRKDAERELLEKGHWSGELVHTHKNGTQVPIITYWTLKRNAQGQEDSTLIVSHDLTEQRAFEEALRAGEERLAGIIGSAMDAIITISKDQRVVMFNKAAEQIFGISAPEALGKPLDMFIPEQFRQVHPDHIRQFSETGETARSMTSPAVLTGRRANGEEFPFEATISQETIRGEKLFTVILRDITQRQRTEAALMRSEKLASLGRLAASVAHELNNPLAAVNDLLYLIDLETPLDEHARMYVRTAQTELAHAIEIGKRTLGFSKSGGAVSAIRPGEILQDVLALLAPKLRKKAVVCETEVLTDCQITGVETDFRQVFWNLLGNSLDAVSQAGRIKIRISENLSQVTERGVRITVADNGPGINEQSLQHLFEPFFTTKETGNGLGLWVIGELLKKHGGSIRVRSRFAKEEGNGAVFSVFLPSQSKMAVDSFPARKAS